MSTLPGVRHLPLQGEGALPASGLDQFYAYSMGVIFSNDSKFYEAFKQVGTPPQERVKRRRGGTQVSTPGPLGAASVPD